VLKQLGVEGASEDAEGGRPLALLETPLPDWTAFVAANLLVDGMLATFVAACATSTVEPMAQRARKILQEEGSHRVHGEAWARRLCRAGDAARDGLVARLGETWAEVARWPGPDDDPGMAAVLDAGMVAEGPGALRERVRGWLTALLAAEGARITLAEPDDWAGWDAALRR
jgi:1,2-phenylacetyl-CoA epoxidase catalytic subunit